jgi:hypothetical protein
MRLCLRCLGCYRDVGYIGAPLLLAVDNAFDGSSAEYYVFK